jgi:hypothetical protein
LIDSLSDSYLNPSESVKTTTSDINYVQTTVIKPRVVEIPVIDCRKEQRIPNYKDVDHQRTKALREVTDHRIQERFISFFVQYKTIFFFIPFRSVK